MREIKVRAWDKEEKIYRYLDIDDAMMPELNPEDGCLEFRGEYTGLKDKNGVLIQKLYPLYKSLGLSKKANNQYLIIGNIYENPELLNNK